jgi:acyl-CoA synthetase (NDP forming)
MGDLHFDRILHARSVAVIGGGERQGSAAYTVMRNLIDAGYPAPSMRSTSTIARYWVKTACPR